MKMYGNMFRNRLSRYYLIVKRNYAFDKYDKQQVEQFPIVPRGAYVSLIVPVCGLVYAGVQYVKYLNEKKLCSKLKQRTKQESIPLPTNLPELKTMEFTPINLVGEFDHDNEFVIDAIQRFDEEYVNSRKIASYFDTDVPRGGLVVTPFKLADKNHKVLVSRGWVPQDKIPKQTREAGQIKGRVEIVGITRNNEKRPTFAKENEPEKDKYFYRNVESMAWNHDALPYFFEATFESTVPGGPIGGQTKIAVSKSYSFKIAGGLIISCYTLGMWYNRFYRLRALI